MSDTPKAGPEPASRIDTNNTQTNPEQTAEGIKQRESAIRTVQNIPALNSLDGSVDFLAYLKQADIADVQQFLQLVQFLQQNNQLQSLIMKLDSSCGDGFPDGKTVKFSDIFKSLPKEMEAAKAELIDTTKTETKAEKTETKAEKTETKAEKTETKAEKTETIKIKEELIKDLQSPTGAPNAFKTHLEGKGIERLLLLQKSDKTGEKEQFRQILKEFQAELLANGSKDNFVTYKRVAENFRTLGVIDERQFIDWMGAMKPPVEGGAQPQKAEIAFNGYEKHGDTFLKASPDGKSDMMIADGKMMCIGKEGFKLSSYFPSREVEQQYVEYRQKFEALSTEKSQKEVLVKNLGDIINNLGPITANVTPDEFVQRITEAGPFNNPTVKNHFENFLREHPNMRREDKIKSILNAVLAFAGLDKLPPGMPLMLSLANVRGRLGEKNKQTNDRVKQIDEELKRLKNPQLEEMGTEQERKEKLMEKTVKYVEALGLDCFGSRADIERLLQKFRPILEKAGDGFAPDIGSGEHWMGKESIKSLCNIISTLTGITPKENLYDNLEGNPPTLKTLANTKDSKTDKTPSTREEIRNRLQNLGIVKDGIFDAEKAKAVYDSSLRQSQEQIEGAAERKKVEADVAQLVGNVETPKSKYIVQPGDNLTRIAHAHQLTLTELLQANKDIDPKKYIHPGDRIVIPAKKTEAPKAAEKTL